ncbi:unnamed protein product [Acidithrix sp. C25]|nr:unnamed protein product [Acidithrix sp. C25]
MRQVRSVGYVVDCYVVDRPWSWPYGLFEDKSLFGMAIDLLGFRRP